MIELQCKGCGKTYHLSEKRADLTGKCALCGTVMKVKKSFAKTKSSRKAADAENFVDIVSRISAEKSKLPVLGHWRGNKNFRTNPFKALRPWMLSCVVEGGNLSFLSVRVKCQWKIDTLAVPLNLHHISGTKLVENTVWELGEIYLNIVTGGPDPMVWFILANELIKE